MTGKVINLRNTRRAKARDDKRDKGNENAARFGRSRAEKTLDKARAAQAAKNLDAHKRET